MKKIFLLTVLLILLPQIVFGQLIDKSVATIKLAKTETITQKQFKRIIQSYEKRMGRTFSVTQRKQLLEQLIDEKLVLQAAEKAGISVSDGEIKQGLQQVKLITAEAQLGTRISDEQYQKMVEAQESQTGLSWESLMEQVKNQAIIQKYIRQEQSPLGDSLKKPTDEEILDFYEENRASYVSPEMIKIKQVLVITQGISEASARKYKAKIDEIYDKIVNKGSSFDEFNEVYVEGQTEKIGGLSISVWQRDDEQNKTIYGKEFFNKLFKMKEGSLSAVLKSNVGYHIVQNLEKIPFKTLELDDKIPPKNVQTVKEQIAAGLEQRVAGELFQQASAEVVEDLRKTAMIKVYDKNLDW